MYSVTDSDRQIELLAGVQTMVLHVPIERLATNQLHRKKGLRPEARISGISFVDLRDARMLQAAERLGFVLEPAQSLGGSQTGSNHLDGNSAARLFLLGFVDCPHPTFTEQADNAIAADNSGVQWGATRGHGRHRQRPCRHLHRRCLEEIFSSRRIEERHDFQPKTLIPAAGLRYEACPVGVLLVKRGVIQALDLLPALRFHLRVPCRAHTLTSSSPAASPDAQSLPRRSAPRRFPSRSSRRRSVTPRSRSCARPRRPGP